MKIFNHISENYYEDPARYFGFEKYEHLMGDIKLFYGASQSPSIFEPSTSRKILFATEEQIDDEDESYEVARITSTYQNAADEILSISPLCYKRPRRKYVFMPFNEEFEPQDKTKIWDVIYTGGVSLPHVENIISTITQFNYRFVSFNHPKATNRNVLYREKLQLVANSKISVVHNFISPTIPQVKTRPFEAAFSKTLILCKFDKFKTLESWFTPGEDFLYYYEDSELKGMIQNILNNYSDYSSMIENAYVKAKNEYTTRHFVEKYLR